jgi:hypothetical protein
MITIIRLFWKQILFVLMVLTISILGSMLRNSMIERARLQENFHQMQQDNSTLTLTVREFKDLLKTSEQRTFRHFDSLFKANKINPKGVVEAHNITNIYRDTTIINIPVPVALEPKPITVGDKCWGFSGIISPSGLTIKEKYFSSEIDLVDYARPKKFLFIRIGWHPPDLKAFSDCGTVTVKSYKRARDAL